MKIHTVRGVGYLMAEEKAGETICLDHLAGRGPARRRDRRHLDPDALALYLLLDQAANSLHRDALRGQASTIGSFLRPQPAGGVELDIPSELQPLYSGGYGFMPTPWSTRRARPSPRAPTERRCFLPMRSKFGDWLMRRRSTGSVLFGISLSPAPVGDRLYWIQVGQDWSHRDVIIDDIVSLFFPRVAWITFRSCWCFSCSTS